MHNSYCLINFYILGSAIHVNGMVWVTATHITRLGDLWPESSSFHSTFDLFLEAFNGFSLLDNLSSLPLIIILGLVSHAHKLITKCYNCYTIYLKKKTLGQINFLPCNKFYNKNCCNFCIQTNNYQILYDFN